MCCECLHELLLRLPMVTALLQLYGLSLPDKRRSGGIEWERALVGSCMVLGLSSALVFLVFIGNRMYGAWLRISGPLVSVAFLC